MKKKLSYSLVSDTKRYGLFYIHNTITTLSQYYHLIVLLYSLRGIIWSQDHHQRHSRLLYYIGENRHPTIIMQTCKTIHGNEYLVQHNPTMDLINRIKDTSMSWIDNEINFIPF